MAIGIADLHTALVRVWLDSGLDTKFRSLWASTIDAGRFLTLYDQQAAPGAPFPYCVFETEKPRVIARMSREGQTKWHLTEVTITFNVHADRVAGDSRSSKQLAAYLAEEVEKVFGGHPTTAPGPELVLANGKVLNVQYQNDWPTQTEDYRCQWQVTYNLLVDVPAAVAA